MRSVLLRSLLVPLFAGAIALGAGAQSEPTLFRTTLVQDISTAGFYELIGWLETVGLSTRGDRDTLVDRLYDYYEVPETERPPARTADPEADDPELVVDSASQTRYFTLEEVDERYIRLSGGVLLTLRDATQDAVHRIEADEITFNQEQRTLAASGSVVYTLERGGTTERFIGEALTVELDTWEGAFVQGVTERARTIEGEEIDFAFGGTYITRSRDDVIVLEDGRITSSEAVPPNYEIRASKIWVLAPGEWGLRNAALYVGRVPLFYLPFFFRPGNKLFFNPALGVRDRSGSFIQTTTYLRGSPEERTSAFSLLQLAEEEGSQSAREIEGLYLVPAPEREGRSEGGETDVAPRDPAATVRVLADVYTKLGAYVALDGLLPELGPLRTFEFYLALAASRHIYTNSTTTGAGATGFYAPYRIVDGRAVPSWNVTRIGAVTLPFRYGVDVSTTAGTDRIRANVQFELYSDHRFRTDFGERSEQIDWLGLVGQGTPTTAPSPVSSLLWQIDANYRADTSALERVSRLAVQRALVALNWRSATIADELLPPEVVLADDSPQARYFYPDSLRFPEISATFSGNLLTYPSTRRPDEEPERTRPELIPPWSEPEEETAPAGEPDVPLVLPSLQPQLTSPRLPAPFTATVGYSLAPTLFVDRIYYDELWSQPSDVDFAIKYGGASVRLAGSLSYGAGVSSNLVQLNGSLATNSQYRDVYDRNPGLPDSEWEALQVQAWSFTSLSVTNNLTLRTTPLRSSRLWSGSNLAYSVNTLLFQNTVDPLSLAGRDPRWVPEFIEFDDEYFRGHQVQATAQLDVADTQSLQLTAAIPPRDERYTGRLSLRVDPVSLVLGSTMVRPDDWSDGDGRVRGLPFAQSLATNWTYEPLTANLTVQPVERLTLSNALAYDIMAAELASNRTGLTAGPVSAEFEVRSVEGYRFEDPETGWEPTGEVELQPTRARLAVDLESDFDPFWRNRVVARVTSNLAWESNLVRFTESALNLTFGLDLLVHRFLSLTLRTTSTNSETYVYVPALADRVGRPQARNLIVDLLKSFNFFNREDREQSAFNLQTISLNAVHDLGDWDLTLGYSGRPEIETADDDPDAIPSYRWRGTLDLTLQWRPISELSTTIGAEDGEITFGDDS